MFEDPEDDVQFVSEAPLRPVLECIDLLSDGDDEDDLPAANTIEQQVDRQRAHAVSTLDRLAQQVAVEKQERAEKRKAFKEKMISLQAQGRRELSVSHDNSASGDAKRCVDIWLKMPGLQPGSIYSGSLWKRRSAPPAVRFSPQSCPVINCGRVYDNIPLLQGHLKRFDHSPCDPTITLKGTAPSIYACLACGEHFCSQETWKQHMQSKLSSDGHRRSQMYQMIVGFACPSCYFLFNSKDECCKHMNARKHNRQVISLTEEKASAVPVPVPRFAKQRLIALCKDIGFSVRCTVCSQRLNSHMEATAHFNVHCRDGCAIATADQTVADMMKKMAVVGHCISCPEVFLSLDQMQEHKERMKHDVENITLLERALLHYSNHCETRTNQKRASNEDHSAKRKRAEDSDSQVKRERKHSNVAWFCECGLRFVEENHAKRHQQAANQIFHKCAVCGKLTGESSIARLHMSRFHGGAHLSNFLFYCRKCKVEMPRMEDIMAHVSASHQGHNYYEEREDSGSVIDQISAKPSTSKECEPIRSVSPKKTESWLCRMCEDLFDSEKLVRKHCGDLSSHSFQRFACGHCPQKFFKDSTLRRHCANEHNGDVALRYFCGLCDSMLFDTENEFQVHYDNLHSQDYYRLETSTNHSQNAPEVIVNNSNTSDSQTCLCMGSKKSREERKPVYTNCMKQLAAENKCRYRCRNCAKSAQSYAEMKTHILLKHKGNGKSFDVVCMICSQSHKDVPSFHAHHHIHHCQAEPCTYSRPDAEEKRASGVNDAEEKRASGVINAEEKRASGVINAEEKRVSSVMNAEEKRASSVMNAEEKRASSVMNAEEKRASSVINAEEIFPQSNVEEAEDVNNAIASGVLDVKKETTVSQDDGEGDDELEEALRRSLEEF
ncbi:E3 SUMO-protein ligase ZNF451 isoform X2 [Danio rerio]|uniref:E3 SUMO-protein ligase ZNF451 isoform X2 n=2 Tax=Danio rerio TaxID=7955 RepID=A0A8M6Z1V8_DANRE|nr:E3 SUMO-protein ligase ZNF451 isoform X3 [Danio rerio]|eukprot:XP_017214398.1 E3 SUMO-protein ligase ZNF451 isoform X3 [Danio rerio]